jgi:hypothetical protein
MTDLEKIELIREYAEDHPSFDLGFVESVADALDYYGELTESQADALDNIIFKFRMHKGE